MNKTASIPTQMPDRVNEQSNIKLRPNVNEDPSIPRQAIKVAIVETTPMRQEMKPMMAQPVFLASSQHQKPKPVTEQMKDKSASDMPLSSDANIIDDALEELNALSASLDEPLNPTLTNSAPLIPASKPFMAENSASMRKASMKGDDVVNPTEGYLQSEQKPMKADPSSFVAAITAPKRPQNETIIDEATYVYGNGQMTIIDEAMSFDAIATSTTMPKPTKSEPPVQQSIKNNQSIPKITSGYSQQATMVQNLEGYDSMPLVDTHFPELESPIDGNTSSKKTTATSFSFQLPHAEEPTVDEKISDILQSLRIQTSSEQSPTNASTLGHFGSPSTRTPQSAFSVLSTSRRSSTSSKAGATSNVRRFSETMENMRRKSLLDTHDEYPVTEGQTRRRGSSIADALLPDTRHAAGQSDLIGLAAAEKPEDQPVDLVFPMKLAPAFSPTEDITSMSGFIDIKTTESDAFDTRYHNLRRAAMELLQDEINYPLLPPLHFTFE